MKKDVVDATIQAVARELNIAPDSLREVELKIRARWGGIERYVTKGRATIAAERAAMVRDLADRGYSATSIAKNLDLTIRRVDQILKCFRSKGVKVIAVHDSADSLSVQDRAKPPANVKLGACRPDIEPFAVSIEDAAAMLAIHRTKMFALLSRGKIESIRIGSRRVIPLKGLREFMDRNTER